MARRPVVRWLTEEQVKPLQVDMNAKPKRKKAGTPERDFQMVAVEYLEMQFRDRIVVAAVVNEAPPKSKNPGSRARFFESRRKAGVKQGFPDLVVFMQFPICFLFEAKSKVGAVRDEQQAMHDKLRALGWEVHVVRTLEDIQAALRAHNLIR